VEKGVPNTDVPNLMPLDRAMADVHRLIDS
jgi:hypothetical protein